MTVEENLREMERAREAYWLRYPGTASTKLRWRALTVRHCFHVLPGESVLELGAGSGIWTQFLSTALHRDNEITAIVFNRDLAECGRWNSLHNVRCLITESLHSLPSQAFDYVVGTSILCHDEYEANLVALHRLLKPGGQLLFFENNFWNPQVLLKNTIRPLGRWSGNATCQVGLRRYQLLQIASQAGFSHLDVVPYDIIHPLTPKRIVTYLQSVAFLLEHMPVVKDLCGTLYIRARRPGPCHPRRANLAMHPRFYGAVSFIIPCYNEESNVEPLISALVSFYDPYIHEIIIVNDNSTDRTAEVTRSVTERESRVKLLNREPPGGVGRALKDGCAAATGAYLFTMDGDFVQILPECRDLFDAVNEGFDGAVGSRFTHESIMINYPFVKILCNRGFHLLANLVLRRRMRDISNNLKLYRADVFRQIQIEQPDFAANAEIGLKAIVAGFRIREVPISWINRTINMGSSSFRIARAGPNYVRALIGVLRSTRRLAHSSPKSDYRLDGTKGRDVTDQ